MKKNAKGRKPRVTGAAPAPTNIYIVDGHPIVVCGLSTLIHSIPGYRVVGANSDWNLALSEIEKLRPDLLLLELSLKRRNGLGILKDLKVRIPTLKVLVVSMDQESTYALRTLKAG